MKVICKKLRKEFTNAKKCEWCGKSVPHCDAAHVFAKGMGGGRQLDIRINLIALCRRCHQDSHDGNRPMQLDLLLVVAQREDCLQDDIKNVIWLLHRLPKGSKYCDLTVSEVLPERSLDLALRVFKEIGKVTNE